MIIWIASYPKSGNTWVRALLTYYFFSKVKKFDFALLKNIPNFNVTDFVDNNQIIKTNNDIIKNWLPSQEYINKKFKRNLLFKTHNACIDFNGSRFTNNKVSAGCIYIVRDPRNIITSYKNFENKNYEAMIKMMFDEKSFLFSNEETMKKFGIKGIEVISSWAKHYESWVHNKLGIPVCLIKYEDLLNDPFMEFSKIFNFLKKINNEKQTIIDKKRLQNTISETSFENLKHLENTDGFIEKQNREIKFFNQGKNNDWNKILPKQISNQIKDQFLKEMKELGYV